MERGRVRPQALAGVEAWADQAFAQLTARPGVHRVGLALVEGGGRRLRFTASDRDGGAAVDWCDVDAYDDVPLNTALRSGDAVIGSLGELRARYPDYVSRQRGTPTVDLAAVPVVADGRTLGGFLLLYDRAQRFDRRHRLELARIGHDLGVALRRVRAGDRRRPQDLTQGLTTRPAPPGALVATFEVEADPAGVAEARHFLRRTLHDWHVGDDLVDDATLCLSELVTNSLIHSDSGCLVRTVLLRGVLTTTVHDWGASSPAPSTSSVDPWQVHGRGLQVVDALAARWGHELDAAGASVWFALDVG